MSALVIMLPVFIYGMAIALLLAYVLILRWVHPASVARKPVAHMPARSR
jgi:hypothetical protein